MTRFDETFVIRILSVHWLVLHSVTATSTESGPALSRDTECVEPNVSGAATSRIAANRSLLAICIEPPQPNGLQFTGADRDAMNADSGSTVKQRSASGATAELGAGQVP